MKDVIKKNKDKALKNALAALDDFALNHRDADKYSKVQVTLSIYAQLCLVDKASTSSFAACELSKQHRLHMQISLLEGLPHLVKNLDKFHLSSEETTALKQKLDLMPQFKKELTVDEVNKAMVAGEITIDTGQKLMKMIEMQKENSGFDGVFQLTKQLHEVAEKV